MSIRSYLDKLPSLEGKNILVTGANSGIGLEACRHLAYKKAIVYMACRNPEKGEKARTEILKEYPDASVTLMHYDQADFHAIDQFVQEVKEKILHLDGLVCNAGVYFPKADYKTKDGYELTLGTNYLGVFHLVESLKDKLNEDATRVLGLASVAAVYAKKKYSLKETGKLNRDQIYGYSKYCVERYFAELMKEPHSCSYRLVHPGVTATNIIASEQTGLPTWFSRAGHRFLTLFTHSPKKASLVILKGLTSENGEKTYIGPRGLFAVSGYPKEKKIPGFADKKIIAETRDYLNERN